MHKTTYTWSEMIQMIKHIFSTTEKPCARAVNYQLPIAYCQLPIINLQLIEIFLTPQEEDFNTIKIYSYK